MIPKKLADLFQKQREEIQADGKKHREFIKSLTNRMQRSADMVDAEIEFKEKFCKQKLFLVGEVINKEPLMWNFQGVYSFEEKAISKCLDDNFFIALVEVDFDGPRDLREFDYFYYPTCEPKPE
jgi:hypothetical protein